jgi:acyl-CoA dehydrogenase
VSAMDFRLSDEQEMFRKSVRDYVNRELPKSWARDLEKDEHAFPHELFGKPRVSGRWHWPSRWRGPPPR